MIHYETKIPTNIERFRIMRRYIKKEIFGGYQPEGEPNPTFHIEVRFGWWIFSEWKPIGNVYGYDTLEEAKKWVDRQCYRVPNQYAEVIEWSGDTYETR